jgi:hypothetical protein
MSTYVDVYVDDHFVCGIRNPFDLTFIQAFRPSELRVTTRASHERRHLHLYGETEAEVPELTTGVRVLRDRLATMGFGGEATNAAVKAHVEERLSWVAEWIGREGQSPEALDRYETERQELLAFDSAEWRLALAQAVQRCVSGDLRGDEQDGVDHLLPFSEFADVRLTLRALVDCIEDGEIALDLYELLAEIGDDEPHRAAHPLLLEVGDPDPPVLLTEGSTDALVISTALKVLAPHLDGYVRFFDYEARPEGGAAALSRFVRAFAAAGIKNRVVAIFDNDTAGIEQLAILETAPLPHNIHVHALPDLPSAVEYPTRGPAGTEMMNVNGSAASIELYLGSDVLGEHTGGLRAVQWTGYNTKMDRYQGEVIGKADVLEAFKAKAQQALQSPEARVRQDWVGMTLVLETILDWLADVPPY